MFDSAKKTEKITDHIIGQVRDAILSGQLKPGDRLASEKDLVEQFGVSKATLREALRALEVMGLVESRKGATGGIFITEVTMQTTIHSLVNFLHFKSLSISEITMLRFILEPVIVRMAASRIIPKDIQKLRKFIDPEDNATESRQLKDISFHRYLSRMTQNSMLILIVDFIESHLDDIKKSLELEDVFYTIVRETHQTIVTCLAEGDADGACRAMEKDVIYVGEYLADKLGEEAFSPAKYNLAEKKQPRSQSLSYSATTPYSSYIQR